jgi:hypothetical protein
MNVITQAFAGHLGDLELASVSFACTVLAGFNYGLMVRALMMLLFPIILRDIITFLHCQIIYQVEVLEMVLPASAQLASTI